MQRTNVEVHLKRAEDIRKIHKIQAMRLIAVTSNLEGLLENQTMINASSSPELPDSPVAAMERLKSPIIGLALDTGRVNTCIPAPHQVSFFQDHYFREYNSGRSEPSWLMSSGIHVTSYEPNGSIIIKIASDMAPILKKYFGLMTKKFSLQAPPSGFASFIDPCEASMDYLEMPHDTWPELFNLLSLLGAWPNRDWQLLYYIKRRIPNLETLRSKYFNQMRCQFPSFPKKIKDEICRVPDNMETMKAQIIALLDYQKVDYVLDSDQDARRFYLQFLKKLTQALPSKCTHKAQCLLALDRMNSLLQSWSVLSYPLFLRSIELCIDELLLIFSLECTADETSTREEAIVDVLRQFILKTIGVLPAGITLRSSAMHAISTSLALILESFEEHYDAPQVFIFVENTVYYEIFNVLSHLLDLSDPSHSYMSAMLDRHRLGRLVPYHEDKIYDLYVASFEANVSDDFNNRACDLSVFIKNQFRLRDAKEDAFIIPEDALLEPEAYIAFSFRPLVVLIDNTISDVTEGYLSSLLKTFEDRIETGELTILVVHSGNKYLTLGTDKGLAALLYGYYNPEQNAVGKAIEAMFVKEKTSGTLGGFYPHSPTVLLTTHYLQWGLDELCLYKKSLHRKTCVIYNTLLKEGLLPVGYFQIPSPMLSISDRFNPSITNKTTFLSIKMGYQFKNKILYQSEAKRNTLENRYKRAKEEVCKMLRVYGIGLRDSFGLSQTTYIMIEGPTMTTIRINIGTEDTEAITAAIKEVVHFINAINALLSEYESRLMKEGVSIHLVAFFDKTLTLSCRTALERREMINEDQIRHTPSL